MYHFMIPSFITAIQHKGYCKISLVGMQRSELQKRELTVSKLSASVSQVKCKFIL